MFYKLLLFFHVLLEMFLLLLNICDWHELNESHNLIVFIEIRKSYIKVNKKKLKIKTINIVKIFRE